MIPKMFVKTIRLFFREEMRYFFMKFIIFHLVFLFPLCVFADVQILDSDLDNKNLNWSTVNDTVMGGRSSSIWESGSFSSSIFKGYLSLENNGGFASVRHDVRNKDFSDESGIYLKFIGDGRTYQFRIRSKSTSWADYYHDFETQNDKEISIFLPFQDFKASWRGLNLRMLPSLKSRDVIEVGLFLSDKKQGKFKLEISEILAMTEESFEQYLNSSLSLNSIIQRVKYDANQLKLSFETSTNFNYKIESSSDLTNWKNYQTVPGAGETINYYLKNDAMNKFYRIRVSAK